MTQSTGNNLFDGSDIQRYHSGQMTAEEKHALEKAALDDPFLADALEGYTYTTTANEDLLSIRSRLDQKTNRRKVIPLFTRTWMKVAAILFVIAGGVWLVLRTQNNSENSIAVEQLNRKVNAENKVATSPDSDLDSTNKIVIDEKLNDEMTSAKPGKNKTVKMVEKVELPDASFATTTPEKDALNNNESSRSSTTPAQNQYSNIQRKDQNDLASGAVGNTRNIRGIDDINRTMPQVNVQERLANSQANANRVRSWTESDSIPSGFTALQKSQSDSVMRFNVVMTPQQSEPLKEVIVSRGVAKKETDMKGRMAGIVIDTLEPAEGWTNFDDYIAGNLKVPDELKQKPVDRGEVELSFEINQKGEPVNITVVKSLCKKCDEEAKRLLKEGPKWKRKKNNKGKVTIRF